MENIGVIFLLILLNNFAFPVIVNIFQSLNSVSILKIELFKFLIFSGKFIILIFQLDHFPILAFLILLDNFL